ncbi:class I SAM-dependent methyltransferase [Bythopirellula polymerisocia]|uniref:THUMP-like domain-containing protein n=1 Tax=Bythopirellula polymerisocia TaxID=2528003 RepID=A0A5C6CS24_9BACT|nr:class I SAM-dependent methyltransferase [Bythopirellula polymerisocia]TWU27312.1 hypothetical protein Pla144_20840 [Bythopirellula polymerisocia]
MTDSVDYHWLVSYEASRWLTEGANSGLPTHRLIEKLRKSLSTSRARLVAAQVTLRAKAAEKFGPLAQEMFFTDRALQQATDLGIARYKACRFGAGKKVTDYCCGIGGDLLAIAERGLTIGLDQDPTMTLLAEANIRILKCDEQAILKTTTAEEYPPDASIHWHLDPDRRVEGRRSTRPQWHSPSEATIEQWLKTASNGAIKFAPAAELSPEWQQNAELEWISRSRSCRQLVAWFGELAKFPGQRRATAIKNDAVNSEPDFFVGDPQTQAPLAVGVGHFVFDTDPCIRAAHLTGALATKLGCEVLSTGAAYLTGNDPVEHPLITCFSVSDTMPLRVPRLAKHLHLSGIGELEIKTRGVSLSPEDLRKRFKLNGDHKATLLLTRQGRKEIAILAERYTAPGVTGSQT